jgi:hypothetical protein
MGAASCLGCGLSQLEDDGEFYAARTVAKKMLRAVRAGTGEHRLAAQKQLHLISKRGRLPRRPLLSSGLRYPGPPVSEPRRAPEPPISARLEPPVDAAAGRGRGIGGELFDHVDNFGSLPGREPDESLEQPQTLDRFAGRISKLLAQLGNGYAIFHLTPLSGKFERVLRS